MERLFFWCVLVMQHLPIYYCNIYIILSPASDRYISNGVLSDFHNQVSPAFSQVILALLLDRLG